MSYSNAEQIILSNYIILFLLFNFIYPVFSYSGFYRHICFEIKSKKEVKQVNDLRLKVTGGTDWFVISNRSLYMWSRKIRGNQDHYVKNHI